MAEQLLKRINTHKTTVVVKLSELFRLFNRPTLTILPGRSHIHSSRLTTALPVYLLLPGYESVDLLPNCAETHYTLPLFVGCLFNRWGHPLAPLLSSPISHPLTCIGIVRGWSYIIRLVTWPPIYQSELCDVGSQRSYFPSASSDRQW